MEIKFKYFSCKAGHAVARFGTNSFVGSIRTKSGFKWNEAQVVAIPESEIIRYGREYKRVIKDGALIPRTEIDYKSWIKIQENKENKAKPADDSKVKPDKPATTDKRVVAK
jgi:hypothetical protein